MNSGGNSLKWNAALSEVETNLQYLLGNEKLISVVFLHLLGIVEVYETQLPGSNFEGKLFCSIVIQGIYMMKSRELLYLYVFSYFK